MASRFIRARSRARSGSSSDVGEGGGRSGAGTCTSLEDPRRRPRERAARAGRGAARQLAGAERDLDGAACRSPRRTVRVTRRRAPCCAPRRSARWRWSPAGRRPRSPTSPGLQPGVGRRAARLDGRRSRRPVPTPEFWSSAAVRALTPRKRAGGRAVLDELLGDPLGGVGAGWRTRRRCCRSATAPGRAGGDGGDRAVDADDLAGAVDQRAAGVAGVDRRVGLDRVDTVRRSAVEPVVTARPVALTMPSVTVLDRPSGAPIATAMSPTCTLSEFAKVAGVSPLAPSSLTTARSDGGSVPTTLAS